MTKCDGYISETRSVVGFHQEISSNLWMVGLCCIDLCVYNKVFLTIGSNSIKPNIIEQSWAINHTHTWLTWTIDALKVGAEISYMMGLNWTVPWHLTSPVCYSCELRLHPPFLGHNLVHTNSHNILNINTLKNIKIIVWVELLNLKFVING